MMSAILEELRLLSPWYNEGWKEAALDSSAVNPYDEESLKAREWAKGNKAFKNAYPFWRGKTEIVGEM